MTMWLRLLALNCVCVAVGLVPLASAQAPTPLRIGASMAKTGQFAPLGNAMLIGYQMCVKSQNDRGGILGRTIELLVEDDQSEPATGATIYERLITQAKVDAVFSPYSTPVTDAVADVTEKHRVPMIAAGAATGPIFKKGRKFLFQMMSPAHTYPEGATELAAKMGLKTLAVIFEDTAFPRSVAKATEEYAKKRGLEVGVAQGYPKGATDFRAILARLRTANPDLVIAVTYFDAVAMIRQMRELNVNPKMVVVTVGGEDPAFHATLGKDAEFVYGTSQWAQDLITIRAGGLVPLARYYPGAREFVETYQKEFPSTPLTYYHAFGYGGCQLTLEAIRRAGSLDAEKVREIVLKMDTNTVFGPFRVDPDGLQVAHKMLMFQWQDGKKIIVWPEELAAQKARFPTPPWSQR